MGGVGHRRRAAHLAKAQQRVERAQVPGVGVAGGAGAITGSAAPAKPRTGPRGRRQPKPKLRGQREQQRQKMRLLGPRVPRLAL